MAEFGSSERGEGRGVGGRGMSSRAAFSGRANIPLGEAVKVHKAADDARAVCQRHYEKNRAEWTENEYGRLLLKGERAPSLTLAGVTVDPKSVMMAKASRIVAQRQANRLGKIEMARKTLMQGGLRPNRVVDWGGTVPKRRGTPGLDH